MLDWQTVIDSTAKNKNFVIKNTIQEAIKTEERKYAQEIGVTQEEEPQEGSVPSETQHLCEEITQRLSSMSPVAKAAAKKAVTEAGLPSAFKKVTDESVLKQILSVIEKAGKA